MSNDLIKFDPSELQKLPDVLKQNQLSKSNAVAAITPIIEKIKKVDLLNVDATEMEAEDAVLNDCQAKLIVTVETMEWRRKPLTKLFDDVRKMFTVEEKEVNDLIDNVKEIRNNWNREKSRRIHIAEEEKNTQIARLQEVVSVKEDVKRVIYNRFSDMIGDVIGKISAVFNSKTIEELPDYELVLKGYTPVLDENTYIDMAAGFPIPTTKYLDYLTETIPIAKSIWESMRKEIQTAWVSKLTTERERLIEIIPSRIRELEAGQDNSANRLEEAKYVIEQELSAMVDNVALESEASKMNVAFDVAAESTPVIGITKGTAVKKKYVPSTHKAYVAIIQWWVTNCMSLMTPDDLQKKFSFMVTAASKSLNEGKEKLVADGLTVEDDFSIRATKKAS